MNSFTDTDLTPEYIQSLVDNKVEESQELEYKESEPKDLLNTVAAMANTSGGMILIGIREAREKGNTAIPEEVVGVTCDNKDVYLRGLDSRVINGVEPRIRGVKPHLIDVNGKLVVAILVPRSINGPHMIRGEGRLYARAQRNNYPMSVDQARHAFMWSHGLREHVRQFRSGRLDTIRGNRVPVSLWKDGSSRLVVHMIPFGATTQEGELIQLLGYEDTAKVGLLHGHGFSFRPNIDGVLMADRSNSSDGLPAGYTQVFSNGILETVCGGVDRPLNDGEMACSGGLIEDAVGGFVRRASIFLKKCEVQPPVSVWVSLLGFKGSMLLNAVPAFRGETPVFDRDEILLPEVILESLEGNVVDALEPLWNSLWRSAGYLARPQMSR